MQPQLPLRLPPIIVGFQRFRFTPISGPKFKLIDTPELCQSTKSLRDSCEVRLDLSAYPQGRDRG